MDSFVLLGSNPRSGSLSTRLLLCRCFCSVPVLGTGGGAGFLGGSSMPESKGQEPGGAAPAATHHRLEIAPRVAPDGPVASLTGVFDGLEADQALAQGRLCLRQFDLQFLHLGALLSTIRRKGWHRPNTFRDYSAQALGLKKSRAAALLRVFETSARLGLNAAEVAAIGWTKMQLVAPHLTQDTVARLLPLAQQHSRAELINQLGPRRGRPRPAAEESGLLEFDDAAHARIWQAIERARALDNEATDAAALVFVCDSFLRFAPLAAGLRRQTPEEARRLLDALADAYGRPRCINYLSRGSPAAPTNAHPGGQTGAPTAAGAAR